MPRSYEDPIPDEEPLVHRIVPLVVGDRHRPFAAHEDVLCQSPFFEHICQEQLSGAQNDGIWLPLCQEETEVFPAVLQYLYKGDYKPCLLYNEDDNTWQLEDDCGDVKPVIKVSLLNLYVLRDTIVYCIAKKFGLEELKRRALQKLCLSLQELSLQTDFEERLVLDSMRYAYENTQEDDPLLRAYFLAALIQNRAIFKRSVHLQAEMEDGSRYSFDLFVAVCNALDDVASRRAHESANSSSPETS